LQVEASSCHRPLTNPSATLSKKTEKCLPPRNLTSISPTQLHDCQDKSSH